MDLFSLISVMDFNTSHVSINQSFGKDVCTSCPISIHLMFLLIREDAIDVDRYKLISIHFMFLLINYLSSIPHSFNHNFNTSHVSINPRFRLLALCDDIISIHLMFLLIYGNNSGWFRCFTISIHLMFLLI